MNGPALAALAALKQGARATWAAGDYPDIARRQLWEVGPRIVAAAAVRSGEDVLDVACGTGNVALRAAEAGARVVGVDLTPELFEAGRALAAEAQVTIDWIQGDAENLPFDDESFDVVTSSFGCMFAPRHAVTAGELARVLRPAGRLVITAWTPEGSTGKIFRTIGGYLPPPPAMAEPPILWGVEDHVAGLFAGSGIELTFERGVVTPEPFGSTDEALTYFETKFGPMMMARQLAEAAGTWGALRAELADHYERDEPAEYLLTVGSKR
jgi:SAM-dependent methyltransferase